jgi:nucleoside-diphosphate-sugar epimerase
MNRDAMKILVTGGAGFIGRHFRRSLLENGHEVRTFDISSNPTAPGVEHVVGDLLDPRSLARAVDRAHTIVHLAAKHRFFGVSAEEFRRVNVDGTRNLLEVATRAGVQRLVFYSSVAVYGDQAVPTTEDTPCRPTTPYGETKLAAERLVKKWASESPQRHALIIRPTVVFGPGNKGNIYRLIRQIDRGWFVPVGPGTNIKSIAYVENLVQATLFLMSRHGRGVEIFNYADEPHLTFREIGELIHRYLCRRMPHYSLPVAPILLASAPVEALVGLSGRDLPIRAAIRKMNKVTHHSAEKLRQVGFTAPCSIDRGLQQMIEWYRASLN